jgi:DNA repair protein RecO (recombination protein O)
VLQRTESIVLKNSPYGEADLLVTFLTLDFGIVNAFAKSPRKIKSRFGSSLEPLTYSRISLWGREEARLPRLTQSDIIRPFQGLREDLGCFLRLSEMAELTMGFLPEGEKNEKAFRLLKEILEMMERGSCALYTLIYKIKFLGLTGYAPRLRGCARCGREGKGFYISHGSILCNQCAGMLSREDKSGSMTHGNGSKNGSVTLRNGSVTRSVTYRSGSVTLSPGSLRLYETLKRWDLEKTARIKVSVEMLSELSGMLDAHIEYRLSKPLKTREAYASFRGT